MTRNSCTYATCLILPCDVTHPYMWHDASIYATWLIHMRDLTNIYRLIHTCDMTHYICDVTWRDVTTLRTSSPMHSLQSSQRYTGSGVGVGDIGGGSSGGGENHMWKWILAQTREIYIYVRIYVYIYMYICTYTYIYICIQKCTCMYTYINT